VLAMGAYLNLELALDTQNEPGRYEGGALQEYRREATSSDDTQSFRFCLLGYIGRCI
jgi:hypothetical protein